MQEKIKDLMVSIMVIVMLIEAVALPIQIAHLLHF
jgi:hypothetical protein